MTMIAKIGNKIVEVVRVAETVAFSSDRGWVCICGEPGKTDSLSIKWVPATTRFEWIKEFNFECSQ